MSGIASLLSRSFYFSNMETLEFFSQSLHYAYWRGRSLEKSTSIKLVKKLLGASGYTDFSGK